MRIYQKLFSLLTVRERIYYVLLGFLALLLGLVEMVNIASVMPFLAILANPDVIHSNAYLSAAYTWSGATDDRSFLVLVGFGVFVMIVFSQGFRAFVTYQLVHFTRMRTHSLSIRLMERYLSQPYVWFLRRNTVELRKTVLQEVGQAMGVTLLPSMQVIAQTFVITCLVVLMTIVDPVTALVVAGVVGSAYAVLVVYTRPILDRLGNRRVISNKRRFLVASDALGTIKEIKLAGLEKHFLNRFSKQSFIYLDGAAKQKILSDIPKYFFEALLFGGIILLILFMLSRSDGDFSAIVPTLGLYAVAAARLFPASQGLYKNLNQMKFGSALLDLLQREFRRTRKAPTLALPARGEPLRLTQRLELSDIHYSFPRASAPVLRGLDLTVEANTTIGIVGGTGAGKTTTVDIILGLLTPSAGTVTVDNTTLNAGNLGRWQQGLGYVPQHITLLDETVRGNIAFGVPPDEIDDEAVERAARAAELHDFIMTSLAEGYETRVGERGNRLSGGQRQRIGIARALYHDPDLLILDEATSALDNVTERQVMESIHSLKRNKTIIMIAHRLTTVRNCDRIFVLENGSVRNAGTFDMLYGGDDTFRQMVDAQH